MIARGFTRLGKAAASFHTTLTAELESAEPLFAGTQSPGWLYRSPLQQASVLFAPLLMDVTPCPRSRRWH